MTFEQVITIIGAIGLFLSLVIVPIVVALINTRKAKSPPAPDVVMGQLVQIESTTTLLRLITDLREDNERLETEIGILKNIINKP